MSDGVLCPACGQTGPPAEHYGCVVAALDNARLLLRELLDAQWGSRAVQLRDETEDFLVESV